MVDIKLNPLTRDIDITDNTLSFTSSFEEESRQRLITALSIFLGEWFANTLFGLPYFQQFLTRGGKNRNLQNFIDITLEDYIESLTYVREVSSLNSSISIDRVYSVNLTILLITGQNIELNSFDFNLEG